MKENKIKYLIILIGIITFFPINVVGKTNATVSSKVDGSPEAKVYYNGKQFYDRKITINMNGNLYDAYCVNPGDSLPGNYKCQAAEYGKIEDIYAARGYSHFYKRLAMIEAAFGGDGNIFYCDRTNMDEYRQCNLALQSVNKLKNSSSSSNLKTTLTEPTIEIKKISSRDVDGEYEATHSIYTIPAVLEDVELVCQNCTIDGQTTKTFSSLDSGTNYEFKIRTKNPNCKYKIIVKYKWSTARTIFCTNGNAQRLWGILTNERNTDKGQQEFSFNVDSTTNYYKNYCTNTPDGSQPCEERDGKFYGINGTEVSEEQYRRECDNTPEPEPITCTEKTTIEKPEYCDDANDQYITITSPKDVKNCILNSKDDAEQTYQMLDGQIKEDNPYCAVYCKEDYKMTMPGAQYANSGRYFELKNTKVEATRTCYTTNPSSDKNKTNIDTQKFIIDVTNAQNAVVDAYNAYKKAERELQLAGNPREIHTNGCNDTSAIAYEIDSSSYNGVRIATRDPITGRYTVTAWQGTTESRKWGTEIDCATEKYNCKTVPDPDGKGIHKDCDERDVTKTTYGTVSRPDFEENKTNAQNALNSALNNLKNIIDNYEECYNWSNNLCMDTIVKFEYDEQYSGDINFERISQTINKDKEVGYASGTTIDDKYTATDSGSLRDYNYLYCDTNGCNNANDATKAVNISFTDTHIKKVSDGVAEYANTQEFQTNYPSGSIETLPPGSDIKHNYSYLGAVFPIALNTSRGVYQWKLNFSKLGQFNDTRTTQCSESSVGRLDNVIEKIGESATANVEYVCVYVVSCDECDYECVGEGCLIPDKPKCPECDVYCENCIFDGNMTYVYQAKSLNELSVHGSNWSTEKGIATKQEIETNGENIYIEEQYTYRLTPDMMKNLRDYNKEKGNYVPDDLSYHELSGVKNAYGTSDFLRNEKNENKYFKTIKRNEVWTLWEKIGDNMGRSWK